MSSSSAMITTTSRLPPTLPLVATGKVRDLYALDADTLLFIATDRISAYDVTLANGIPGKGRLLTLMTVHWIRLIHERLPHIHTHFLSLDLPSSLPIAARGELQDRSMVVRRCKVLPIEAIVRGYITGSAWAEYQRSGTVHGIALPPGLRESEAIPGGALFTPSTKAPAGEKDENISPAQAAELVGKEHARTVQELAVSIYKLASDYAAARGVLIADTKFEFGLDDAGQVVLVDEILTMDSSRFWDARAYAVGRAQESLDKQFLRDWLTQEELKGQAGVSMPEHIVKATEARYKEAYDRLVAK